MMELGKVAPGSAAQSLWLGDRKVGSQVIGEDRIPGKETVGKVRRGGRQGRRASDRTKERVHRFRRDYTDLGESTQICTLY